jgi:tagatose 6-phosphate kinase
VSAPILTVTLNAAVDKTYTVSGFTLGRVHRPVETRVTAGGKGINVARVYQTLGGQATATGFLGGINGNYIQQQLALEGIDDRFIRVAEESRVCIAVMDPLARTLTEINENGPNVTAAECDALLILLRELLPGSGAVILSGSLPPGTPVTLYRDIIYMAQEQFQVPAVLDASGEALAQGITARPFLVKPNLAELAALDVPAREPAEAAQALRAHYGVELALVTAGPQGAVLSGPQGTWLAVPPSVQVLNAVGSGDSLAAGFLWSWLRGDSSAEALRLGVAAGTANTLSDSAGFLDSQSVFDFAARTQVRQIA